MCVCVSARVCERECVCVCVCVRGPYPKHIGRRPVRRLSSSLSTGADHETEVAVAIMMLLHYQELLILQEPLRQA